MSRRLTALAAASTLASCVVAAQMTGQKYPEYAGSRFGEVWRTISTPTDDNEVYPPGSALPSRKITRETLLRGPVSIFQAAKATLADTSDLWSGRQIKLIRPNGICLAGAWNIVAETGYTGLLAQGARASIIARASVTSDETEAGEYRSFGVAGKVFPTVDDAELVKTANFFAIDTNVGSKRRHVLDVELTNLPSSSALGVAKRALRTLNPSLIGVLSTVQKAQQAADTHPETRQLYPLAQAGMEDPSKAVVPSYIKIRGSADVTRLEKADFREELRTELYPNFDRRGDNGPLHRLRFEILLGTEGGTREKPRPVWGSTPVGYIDFINSVVSDYCDERLHFSHPLWVN
jgi:hypothetical protein